jgi:hypothetical protein
MDDMHAPPLGFLSDLALELPAPSPIIQEGAGHKGPPVDQGSLRGDLELVRSAVRAIPNEFRSREEYLRVGYALKAALPDHPNEAFDLWQWWCEQWPGDHNNPAGNNPETVEADWRRMKPGDKGYRIGAHYLYSLAWRLTQWPDYAKSWFDVIPDEPEDPFEAAELREAKERREKAAELREAAQATATRRLDTLTLLDAAASALTESTRPLIKGFLDQQTLSVLYGESNTGKTFLAMDIAFHVAAGLPWGGMKTTQMPVLYIAAEGGRGARRRAAALVKKFGGAAAQANFHFILAPVNLLDPKADLKLIINAIRRIADVGLVVIDTLSRALAGGDENASTDMGAIVAHFDAIRAETGAHVMVVHHTGKNLARGARGHSLLRAATDTEIEVAALSEASSITVTKQRDLEKNYHAAFKLETVTIGTDDDGDPVTSCTIQLTGRDAVAVGKATPAEQTILDALSTLISLAASDSNGVTPKEVAGFLREQQLDINPEGVRAHLKNLAKKNIVVSPARGKWAARPAPTGPSAFFEEIGPAELEKMDRPATGMAIGMDVFA